MTEPLRKPFSIEAIADDWNRAIIWKGKSPKTEGNYWPRDRFSSNDVVYFDVTGAEWLDSLVTIQARWAERFQTYFGYVHAVSSVHVALPEYASRIMPFGQGLAWRDMQKRLPCVAWSMWFGPEYVQRIGRDKLLNAPVYQVSESEYGVSLRMTESARSLIDDYEGYRELRDALVRYLGPDIVAPLDETVAARLA